MPAFLGKAITWLFTTKAGQWLTLTLLKPLFEKTVKKAWNWIVGIFRKYQDKKRQKKLKKENKKKAENYVNSEGRENNRDNFSNMP